MNTKEIIDMARQAGARPSSNPDEYDVLKITVYALEAFAKLVDAKATARERLGCFEAAYGAYATTEVLKAIRNRGDL